jgi:transposase
MQIVAESFEPGANISAVARRHGVNVGLLHYWRKRAKALALETMAADAPASVPRAMSIERMIEIDPGSDRARADRGGQHSGSSTIFPEFLMLIDRL